MTFNPLRERGIPLDKQFRSWRELDVAPIDPDHSDPYTRCRIITMNGAEVIDIAYRRYDLALGAGLARMAGRLFRIGHLGDLNELMLLGGIAGAEMAMRDVGMKITPGSGVAAAEEYWRSTAKKLEKRELPPRAPDAQPQATAPAKEKATAGAAR